MQAHRHTARTRLALVSWYILAALILMPLLAVFGPLSSAQAAYPAPTQSASKGYPIAAEAEYVPGEVLVKFRDSALRQSNALTENYLAASDFGRRYNLRSAEKVRALDGVYRFASSDVNTQTVRDAVEAFRADPNVEFAEPNYIRRGFKTPNDTFYKQGRQYYIDKVNMKEAWDITTGSGTVVIAVLDTGVRSTGKRVDETITGGGNATKAGSAAPAPNGPAPVSKNAEGDCNSPAPNACTTAPLDGGGLFRDLPIDSRLAYQQGYDAVGDCPTRANPIPQLEWCNFDFNGHGTAVTGIIAANGNDGYGMVGIDWKDFIVPVRVLAQNNAGSDLSVSNGLTYAADLGARVINMSLGGIANSTILEKAVLYAQSKGAIIVAASGNSANGSAEYPAAYKGVIAVAATDENDQVPYFSSFGSYVSVAAPGANILTTNVNWYSTEFGKGSPFLFDDPANPTADRGDFVITSGTSFAAPIVTGIIGLMLSVNPNLTAQQVKDILEGTADDIETPGRDDKSGYGRVNAGRALQAVKAGNFVPNKASTVRGIVTGANPTDVVMNLQPGNININTDSSGNYIFRYLGAGNYTLRAVIPRANRELGPVVLSLNGQNGNEALVNFNFATGQIVSSSNTAQPNQPAPGGGVPALAAQSQFFSAVPPTLSNNDLYYFVETGHTLSGAFKRYWDTYGGLAVFGFPTSEPFSEVSATDGKTYTVQYFQRNRFEYHPEFSGTRSEVLLGLLGNELTAGRNFPKAGQVPSSNNLYYFPETGHTLSGKFLQYWQQNGGLAIFGFPISEPQVEGNLLVQYFQRNRFELHPENAGSKYEVLLGLLGNDLARKNNYIR